MQYFFRQENQVDRVQCVQVLLVLDHQVLDDVGEGVVLHFLGCCVCVDLGLPLVEEGFCIFDRGSDLLDETFLDGQVVLVKSALVAVTSDSRSWNL